MSRPRWSPKVTALALFASWLLVVPLVVAAVRPEPAAQPDARVAALPACTIIGTWASETLVGTAGDDVICALGGDDIVRGRGGDDVLFGSFGNDVVEGGPGDDRLKGHWGRDVLRGGRGDDRLHGGGDADVFSGGDGSDLVDYGTRLGPVTVSIGRGANDGSAGEGDAVRGDVERARGGAGDDRLVGDGKANRLSGEGGDDTLIGRKGSDRMSGGAGADRLDGRDGRRFRDGLRCGAGRRDVALANPTDRVATDCESGRRRAPPSPGAPPRANRPPTNITLSNTRVAENRPAGTVVGTLAAADRDRGDTHRFTLVNGNGSDDNAAFSIDGDQLETAAVFDFEAKPSHSIRVRARDKRGAGFLEALTISVDDVDDVDDRDDPPRAVDDSATVAEDSAAAAIAVLANDTDSDGGPMAIASASDPANGAVVVAGGLTYEPDGDFCGSDSFAYTLNGGSTATVSVTVTCAEDPATAVDDGAAVAEDSAATPIDVLANDTDPDGDPITIASASEPANGTVVLPDGGLTYEPDADFCGSDTFTYTLDGGSTATVSVTVTCVDDPPAAVGDSATVAEDSGANAADVLANDADSDGGPMAIASASDPANGTVVLTGGGLTYEPDGDFCGSDSFAYTLNGGSTATVSVTVTCIDDAPTAVDDSATVAEDSPAGAVDVLANDTDPDGGPMAIAAASDPANGTVVLTGGGLTYGPGGDFCGSDSFTYTLDGGSTATVSVTVTCVDDPAAAVDDSATVPEDSAATPLAVLSNDSDPDGDPVTIASASDPANGTVALTGGLPGAHTGLTYQPDPDFCGSDTFTYALNGGSTATVSVTVACGDDPPTAIGDSATVAEDAAADAVDVLANDTDGDGGPMTIASASDPANGTVVLSGGSAGAHTGLTYEPDADFCGSDSFTYTLNGGSTATVTVTVTCIDDPPAAVDDSATVDEDSAAGAVDVLANDTDPDGGPMTIASASDPANGTVASTATGLTYEPNADFCGSDSFTYTLNGGSTAAVSMTVTCAPDDPVVNTSAGTTSYTENAAATAIDAALTVGDPDAATTITGATVEITGNPAGEDILALAGTHPGITATLDGAVLTLTGDATPAAYQSALRDVTYRNGSDAPSTAPRTVTFTVTDDTARSGSDTKGLTVSAVDDPPTAVNDSATALEDAAATAVDALTNDTDVDAGPKTISSASDPANGTVVLTGGSPGARTGVTYQPDPNYCNSQAGGSPDTFTYTLNGGSTATVSVAVTCVNDAPVADDETFDGASGAIGNTALVANAPGDGAPTLNAPKKSISGDILNGDTDVDSGALTVQPVTDQATNDGGRVTIEADGDFTYINDPADNCADTSDFFDYTVSDQNATGPGPAPGTDSGRVTIAIASCVWYVDNDDPSGNSGTSTAPFDTIDQAETASGANHTVFVFDGTGSAYASTGGYAMTAGERLIGEHEGLTVDPDQSGPLASQSLHPANPGAHPTLTATSADVIDLDDGNELRGLAVDPQNAGGIAGGAGDTGGGTIDDVNVVDTLGIGATQAGLELSGTTGTFDISNLTVATGAAGVLLTNAGTTDFGSTTIASNGLAGLSASGTNMGTSMFDAITVTGSSNGGVSMTNTTGTTALGDGAGVDLALSTSSGTAPAFALSNAGTITVPAGGTANVSATGGPAIDVTGTSGAALAFDAVSSTNSAGDGINLAGLGTGTFSAQSGAVGGAAGIAFDLDGGSGDVSYPGALDDGSGATAEITNRSGGTVALSGTVSDSNDAGGGITMSGNTGGSTTLSGTTKTLNTGASAAFSSTGSGHAITLSGGGLDIDTTGGAGLSATGGGTLVVSGSGNTIDSTTGTALTVSSTAIGDNDVTFQRISSNGAANGIALSNTGNANGRLIITGTGSGTCQSGSTGGCSGGVIQGSTGAGVLLSSVPGGAAFTRVAVLSGGDDGIRGSSVGGLSLANSVVLGNGNAVGERGIEMTELGGSGGLAATTVSGSGESNVRIENDTTTLAGFDVTGSTIANTNMTTGDDGILVLDNGSAAMTVTVTGSTFTDNKGDHFQAASDASSTGSVDVTFDNNTLTTTAANDPNVVGGGITLNPGSANNLSFKVRNNNIQQAFDDAINLNLDPSSTAAGSLIGTVSGNTIGTAGQAGSGSESSNTVTLRAAGQGLARVAIQSNTIREWTNAHGISIATAEGSADIDATVTGNSVKNPDPTLGLNGIRFDAGATAGPPIDDGVLCAAVTGNDVTGSGVAGAADIRLRQRFGTTIRLPGYSGANNADTAVESFVQANNTGNPVVDATNTVSTGGGGFTGGAPCTLPPP